MDIHCPHCGEPWAVDCLHEPANDNLDFDEARRAFFRDGCSVLGGRCPETVSEGRKTVAAMSSAMHDLLGEDVDGIAAMMEDELA